MNDPTAQPEGRILVIDDAPSNIDLLCQIFEAEGYEVLAALTGQAGRKTACQSKPDLILLDVLLPGEDGFDVCRSLKRDDSTAEIPVIFITAKDDSSSRVEGFRAGGVDYIGKPFQREEVIVRARVHLTISRLTRALRQANEQLKEQVARCQRAEEEIRDVNHSLELRVAERTAQLKEANRQLEIDLAERKRAEETLREFPRRVIEAQEAERKRVANDLHDSVAQLLSSAKHRIHGLLREKSEANPINVEEAGTIRELLEMASDEVRRISRNLRPPELDNLGLPAAARRICEAFQAWSGAEVELKFSKVPKRLPAPVTLNLYRIIQEALNNVQKHAGATRVKVHLTRREWSLELIVEDNGKGFDPAAQRTADRHESGFGLASMRERAGSLRGAFEINSAPGHGTEIVVRLPLR